jgi:hypothetical protein
MEEGLAFGDWEPWLGSLSGFRWFPHVGFSWPPKVRDHGARRAAVAAADGSVGFRAHQIAQEAIG